jgi:hypothetical protein
MGSVTRLQPQVASAEAKIALSVREPKFVGSSRETVLAIAAFICGASMSVRVELVGNMLVGEPALVAVAAIVLLMRGFGPLADRRILFLYAIFGLLMLIGYVVSDLVSDTEPWQYIRGWARVTTLILTTVALIVMVSHSPRSLWWFALGIGLGTLAKLVMEGAPLDQWKLGYGEAIVLLVITLGGRLSVSATAAFLLAFGLLSVALDYRSLGAVAILIAASLLWRIWTGGRKRWRARDIVVMAAVGIAAAAALILTLELTQSEHETRRMMSNLGRYAGLTVASQAIADSPIVGYGSWAADKRYVSQIRQEERRASSQAGQSVRIGDSLMPHSQILQAWVEGGALAAVFFLFYAWHLAWAWWWLMRGHRTDALTPLYLFAIYGGLWNWVASPATGIQRVYIALAVAVIGVLVCERQSGRRRLQAESANAIRTPYAAGNRTRHGASPT